MAILRAYDEPDIPRARLGLIADGVAGIAQTLAQMIAYVKQFRADPRIRSQAEDIVARVPAKDARAEINAIFEWVRDNIRYTMDVRDVETLKDPATVLSTGQGDCDDKSMLTATLLESVGYATRFVAVAPNERNVYEHVYCEVRLGAGWVALETTENVPMGWKPPDMVSTMVRHV